MGSSSTDNNVRAAPQSQPYKRSSSHSNQHSPRVTSKKDKHKNERHSSSTSSDIDDNSSSSSSSGGGGGSSKLTLSSLISLPWVICQFFFRWTLSVFFLDRLFEKINTNGDANDENNNEEDEEDDDEEEQEPISIPPSPALTTLLDHALYRSYQAELVPTVCAATQLLQEFIEMKEAAALIWRECRWMVGVPLSPGLEVGCEGTESMEDVALGYGISVGGNSSVKVYIGGGVVLDERGNGILDGSARSIGSGLEEGSGGDVRVSISGAKTACPEFENMAALEETKWSEFETIQDFAQQCYQSANEAIHRLTTDRLADSANLTLQDSILSAGGIHNMGDGGLDGSGNLNDDVTKQTQAQSASSLGSSTSLPTTPADIGIGRCYNAQPRRDCWESPRLYCPDYAWADDAIGGCQRLLRSLSKHRFVSLVGLHGWNRYANFTSEIPSKDPLDSSNLIPPPEYASSTPHPFPSLEVIHALNYLVSQLLPISIPSSLNQFRAAVEANTVISKRLYLVKCEYRAPLRAHMEGWLAYKAAPKIELVERYLREFHGVNSKSNGEKDGHNDTGATKSKGNITLQKKPSSDGSKKPLQLQRELLEKQISENYWKHPAFVEALQLERCCERLEAEMSQMLMPFANVAREIMDQRKGRLRAVAVFVNQRDLEKSDDDDEGKIEDEEDSDEEEDVVVSEVLGWRDVPYMKELLRRLKSILCRKPGADESAGIRPLLLDIQGVPRYSQGPVDASIEIPFFPPPPPLSKPSFFEWFIQSASEPNIPTEEPWFHLEQFISGIKKLLQLLSQPGTPFLVEERTAGSKNNQNTMQKNIQQCTGVWNEEMFRAQFQDWWDMVKRQRELSAGDANNDDTDTNGDPQPSLSELSETIREAEIELSIAMASKDQLELVLRRLEALRDDDSSRFMIMAKIVNEVGQRELNENIVVRPPDQEKTDFPALSVPGVFGKHLVVSGEVLPVG